MSKQGVFSQQECHYSNIKERSATSYRPYSGFMYIIHKSVSFSCANPLSNEEGCATCARKTHVCARVSHESPFHINLN